MRKVIHNTKKGFKLTGFIVTWPAALLYRVIRFLSEIELGSIFAGFSFILCIVCGVLDYMHGSSLKEILSLYGIIFFILGALGSWSISMFLGILLSMLCPLYRMNQRCKCWNDKINSEFKVNQPLDKFIDANKNIKSYQMRPIQ